MKKLFTSIACFALALVSLFTIVGCGNTQTGKYNVSFGGDIVYKGEAHTVATAQWEKSEEEGFDAVYTLKGEVAYDQFLGDQIYGGANYNIVLIKFTSDTVKKVSYNEEEKTGFYNILNKGTENEKEKHQSFSSGDSETTKTTYFFYQQVDNTVRTLTMHLSFDGTAENEAVYKFVIDPANYTLGTNA